MAALTRPSAPTRRYPRAVELDEVMALFAALEREGVEYVLVGAIAMALQGEVRATQDIDLFVETTAGNVARLRTALDQVFSDPEIVGITAEDLAGDYSVVRYVPPTGDIVVDLIARHGARVRRPRVGAAGPGRRGHPGGDTPDALRDEA